MRDAPSTEGVDLHQTKHLPNRNACEATNHVDDHVSVVERHGVFVLAHLTVLNTKQRDELVVGELEVPNRGGAEADEQGDVLADTASCGDGTKSMNAFEDPLQQPLVSYWPFRCLNAGIQIRYRRIQPGHKHA